MRSFSLVLLGILALAGCNTTGSTAGSTKVALSGKPLKVDKYGSLNPECVSNGSVIIRVLDLPKHGQVEIKNAMDFSTFPPESVRVHCNMKRTPAVQVIYIPSPGYKGPDTFQVEAIFPSGSAKMTRYALEVR